MKFISEYLTFREKDRQEDLTVHDELTDKLILLKDFKKANSLEVRIKLAFLYSKAYPDDKNVNLFLNKFLENEQQLYNFKKNTSKQNMLKENLKIGYELNQELSKWIVGMERMLVQIQNRLSVI